MKKNSKTTKYEKYTDQDIVELVKKDTQNYKYLMDRYESKLLIYIRRIIYVSKEDAEDILQEVFIKAYKNIYGYNPKYKFSNWIYRITHNEAISFLRKKKRSIISFQDEDIFDRIKSDINMEEDFIKESEREKVKTVLSMLDQKYREVLVLKYFEEKEYNEIAEILHLPSGTVASLISRGREKFKLLMERYDRNI